MTIAPASDIKTRQVVWIWKGNPTSAIMIAAAGRKGTL